MGRTSHDLRDRPCRNGAELVTAYGWPHDLDDEEILQRLLDLNHQRAEEES
jgi:hypothetical protein